MDELLYKLNEEQIKPVTDTEGAVLVLAGAGSGKTRVLTTRVAYILREGKADLNHILAITFTNKAANEMKERLLNLTGESDSRWICTIHSMCVKILRQFADRAGIKSNFSIYSDAERNNVLKKTVKEMGYDDNMLRHAKYHIANAKMLGLDPDQYALKFRSEQGIRSVAAIYESYNDHLQTNNALDFDDLLIRTLRLLRSDSETLEYLSDKFSYILVDEFQDINAVQYNIIKLLSSKHGNIFAVGDDDQSIYGWRGAEIENILRFDKDFPSAKVYKLERNYRSTKNILKFANCIIRNNPHRRGKVLWTDGDDGESPRYIQADEELGEALFVADTIANGVRAGRKYSDFAVLMRINALTRPFESEFAKYGIPYKVFGGFRFYERKEIKDVLAYMRLISNPFDSEAAERIINLPRRGIGERTVQLLIEHAQKEGLSLFEAAADCQSLAVNSQTKEKLMCFANVVKEFTASSVQNPVAQLVREIISKLDLRSVYDDGTDDGEAKLANLDEFIASVDDFCRLNPGASLNDYLNQVTLSSDLDDADGGNYVTLSTIHAAKGLEFPVVFLCGLEEGIMPSSRSLDDEGGIDEERRLMYVAITRAEEMLYLTRSRSRFLYGRRDGAAPSRFIAELSPVLGRGAKEEMRGFRYYTGYSGYPNMETEVGKADEGNDYAAPLAERSAATAFKAFWNGQKKPDGDGKKFKVGMKVRHPKFGIGMVVALKNGGNTINVAFDGQGIKELSASLAPLTIIG